MRKGKSLAFLLAASMMSSIMPAMTIAAASNDAVILEQTGSDGQYLQDQSDNGAQFNLGNEISVSTENGAPVLAGKMQLGETGMYDEYLSGAKSFSFAVTYTPSSNTDEYNMILSNGDHGFTLRENNYAVQHYVQFVIYTGTKNSGQYTTLSVDTADGHVGSEHTVVAGYDAENNEVYIYLDGGARHSKKVEGSSSEVAVAEYPLWLGWCPETSRGNDMKFSSVAMYDSAKTADDLAGLDASDSVLSFSASDIRDIDASLLRQAAAQAEQTSLDEFLDAGKAEFTAALDAAKAELEAPETQKTVDAAANALNDAWMNLRLIPSALKLAE